MDDDIVIDCDVCGRTFCGPGVTKVVHRVGSGIICTDCMGAALRPRLSKRSPSGHSGDSGQPSPTPKLSVGGA
ncbi:MAG: hypothetical protein ABSA97_07615 [Verrucomicrobiia bacterium]